MVKVENHSVWSLGEVFPFKVGFDIVQCAFPTGLLLWGAFLPNRTFPGNVDVWRTRWRRRVKQLWCMCIIQR
jgi:hypothetical protein